MTALADTIAEFVTALKLARLPELAKQRATRAIVDTVGVIAAGTASETASILRREAAARMRGGNVPVLGTDLRLDSENAALLNGVAGHALDFDDGYPYYPVHASVPIVAVLAAGFGRIGGARAIESYVAGFETATAIGRGLGIGHYTERGFHATGTLGLFAAVAAFAKFHALDRETTQQSFNIAASMASGLQGNFGTMMKSIHAGWAARNAVAAVRYGRLGITAAPDALDGKGGFFHAYGDDGADPARAARLLGNPLAIVEHGVGMKKFPCVNAAARPLAGLLALKAEHGLTADGVAKIRCILPPGSTRPMRYHRPETGLEGQFSLEYVLAAGLLDPRVGIATFSDEMVRRDAVRPLLGLVEAVEDPRCVAEDPLAETRGPGPRGFVEVHVTTTSGDDCATRVDVAPGYPGREFSPDEMWDKFADCAAYASIDAGRARDVFDALMALEACDDVTAVLADMRPGA